MVKIDLTEVDVDEYRFTVQGTRHQTSKIRELVSGARYKNDKWQIPVRHESLVQLSELYGDKLDPHPFVLNWYEGSRQRRAERPDHTTPQPDAPDYLYEYQAGMAEWLAWEPSGLLSGDAGVGKTRTALHVAHNTGNPYLPSLIVAPSSVLHSWVAESQRLAPDKSVGLATGTASQRRKVLGQEHDLYVMSIDSVSSHIRSKGYGSKALTKSEREEGELDYMQFDCVIVDEAHRLGTPTNKSTRAVWALANLCDRKYALTATPVRNMSIELWGIFRFLDPELWTSRGKFMEFYCDFYEDWFGHLQIRGLNKDRIRAFEASVGYNILRVDIDDVLSDMPDEVNKIRYVDMTAKQRKQYNVLDGSDVYIDGDLELPVSEPAVRHTRLRQMAQGYLSLTADKEYKIESSPKIPEMLDLLAEIGDGESVVIYADYQDMISQITEALPEGEWAVIDGSVSSEDRAEAVEGFQEKKFRYLVCSLGAASEGITLTAARHTVYVQVDYSSVHYIQSRGRTRRIGQESSVVFYHYLVSRDTVDEDALLAVADKLEILGEVRGQ